MSCSSSVIALGYFKEKKPAIFGNGHAVLGGFADLVILSASAMPLDALGLPAAFIGPTFAELQSFMYNTFPLEDDLKVKKARRYWSSIINSGGEGADRAIRCKGIARNKYTDWLLTGHLLDDRISVWSGACRAGLDVSFGWLNALIEFQEEDERFHIPRIGGSHHLLERGVEARYRQNDFEVRPRRSHGFLVPVTGEEWAFLYVFSELHLFHSYWKDKLLAMAIILNMKDISIPRNSVFILIVTFSM